jgi:Ran GTPase-activating protein (RanGAP) involved in mRNA processing and transport
MQSLALPSNSITPAGLTNLAAALGTSHTLTRLDFGDNKTLGDSGARLIASALKPSRSIAEICLDYCAISADGARAIAEAISSSSSLTTVSLSKLP